MPDFGLVTLNIQNVPVLPLAEQPYLLRPGLEVATAGFPLGDAALLTEGRVGQLAPFVRSGIVSSVMPFDPPFPHGFTIDVMSQGGASGSPIFLKEKPLAVGILHSGYPNTNITFAVPSKMIADGFQSLKTNSLDMAGGANA